MGEAHFTGYVTDTGVWTIQGAAGEPPPYPQHNVVWEARIAQDRDTGHWSIHPLPAGHKEPALVKVFDSVTAGNLLRVVTSASEGVVGYNDGRFKNTAEIEKLFPGHRVATVVVKFGDKGTYGDCESGDMSQSQAIASWLQGFTQGIYANKSTWEVLLPVVSEHEKAHGHCKKWVADPNPNNVPHIPVWADGCQYGFDSGFDVSLCRLATFF